MNMKEIRDELARALNRTIDDSAGLAVYGAGDTAEKTIVPHMEELEKMVDGGVRYFIDDTPSKQGKVFCGKPIISLREAQEKCRSYVILLSSIVPKTCERMEQSLREKPIAGAVVFRKWEEYIFCKHKEEVLRVFDLLEDDISKATYANLVLVRMGRAEQDQRYTYPGQAYFGIPAFMKLNNDEVFVDCGAFVGDTLEQYLNVRWGGVQKMYAFEPVDRAFEAMQVRTERLKREWMLSDEQVVLIKAGVGEKEYRTELKNYETSENPATSQALSGESAHGDIPVIALDTYFSEQPITFLKADIEGYEWKMLHGAERVIKRDRPKLAICIYHSPFDMYRLALWIREACPEYKLAVRQHYCDMWETVLYAYI